MTDDSPNPRWAGWLVPLAGSVIGGVQLLHDIPTLVSRTMADDSFYYLEIARNMASGYGSTFDRLSPTNGYQPLFQWLLVPIFWITKESDAALYLTKGLETLLLGCSCALLLRICRQLAPQRPELAFIACAFLFSPTPAGVPPVHVLLLTMESGLNAVTLLLAMFLVLKTNTSACRGSASIANGVALAACALARLDNVFIVGALLVLQATSITRASKSIEMRMDNDALKQFAIVAGTFGIIVAPYMIWNVLEFGHPVPISGRIKSAISLQQSSKLMQQGFGPWLENTAWFFTRRESTRAFILVAWLSVPLLWVLRRFDPISPTATPIVRAFWAGVVLKDLYYAAFQQYPRNSYAWYYVPDLLLSAVLFGALGSILLQSFIRSAQIRTTLAATFALLASVATVVTSVRMQPERDWEFASYLAAKDIARILPVDAVLGAYDAGVLGYYLEQPVVNLDGLVNGRRFFDFQAANRVGDYVLASQIGYVANLFPQGPADRATNTIGIEHLEQIYSGPIPNRPRGRVYKMYRVRR